MAFPFASARRRVAALVHPDARASAPIALATNCSSSPDWRRSSSSPSSSRAISPRSARTAVAHRRLRLAAAAAGGGRPSRPDRRSRRGAAHFAVLAGAAHVRRRRRGAAFAGDEPRLADAAAARSGDRRAASLLRFANLLAIALLILIALLRAGVGAPRRRSAVGLRRSRRAGRGLCDAGSGRRRARPPRPRLADAGGAERYAALAGAIGDLVLRHDRSGGVWPPRRGAALLLGHDAAMLLGRGCFNLVVDVADRRVKLCAL